MAKTKTSTPEKPAGEVVTFLTVKELMAKARALTGDVEESQALAAIEEEQGTWSTLAAVQAPYDPESLLNYIELTPHVKPCIASLAQNVDGYGYTWAVIQPWMEDLDDEKARAAVEEAMAIEEWIASEEEAMAAAAEEKWLEDKIRTLTEKKATKRTINKYKKKLEALTKQPEEPAPEPEAEPDDTAPPEEDQVPAEVQEHLDRLKLQLTREKYIFESWFDHCCSDMSFTDLRKNVRNDVESHGWGCIEWRRDANGKLKRLEYVPGFTVRPLLDRGEMISVPEDDSVTPLSEGREVMVSRRFRIYVQQVGGEKVYFKSPNDPRVISRTTGKVYESVEALRAPTDASKNPGEGKNAMPANELMWIAKHDPKTPCAPPDWIGNLLAVLGIREADETNYFYLANNAIPSGLIFIHGGTVPKATKERLEGRMKHELAGAQNAGKMLVVEARPGSKAAPGEKTMLPAVTFQSLREAHNTDALFSKYDERGADRIGASFRLSPILRGYTPNTLNRATAVAALYFAEQQVFGPLRNSFDWMVTKVILPEIGIRLLRFESNTPPTSSIDEMSKFITAVAPHGGINPGELRDIVGSTLNRDMVKIDEGWTRQPMAMTLNGIQGGGETEGGIGETEGGNSEINRRLREIELRFGQFVTEELRQLGMDYEVDSRFVDVQGGEQSGEEEGDAGDDVD